MKVDPITLEVVRSSLIHTVEQMGVTVQRTAYSPIIYEGNDFVCGVLDKQGNLLAGTTGLPIFLANLGSALRDVDATIGIQNLEPEDVAFCNDSYIGGGTHGNDITAILPIYHTNCIMGFAAFKGHTSDMGGIHPGGFYNDTTEILQELVRIPPVKLYRRGQPEEDLFRILITNCRTPDILTGDIRSMVSALRVGVNSIKDLIDRYGREAFDIYTGEILDQADKLTREALRKIPEGTYEAEYFIDGDGNDDKPISRKLKVAMKIKVQGDHMTVDMSDTDPQSKGPMNSPRASSLSRVRHGFKSISTPFLPVNDGSFRALDIVLKKGTLLDPIPPAACSLWVEAGEGIPDLMLKALAPAIPDRVRAATYGSDVTNFVYGIDPRKGKFYVICETSAPGGWGATPYDDGDTLFSAGEGDVGYPMVEVYEVLHPLMVRRFEFIPDSAGPGKCRGGLGVRREITPLNHNVRVTVCFERQVYSPPWGLFGGKDGKGNYVIITRRDGTTEKHEKMTDWPLNEGDVIVYETGGGGGYGDPVERDEKLVLQDVLDGYVSVEKARDEYGVIINLVTEKVDLEATHDLRQRRKS